MAIQTQQSISGFIATDPQLTYGENGIARFYARFGQEHYRREENGTFTQLEPTFHNLVLYRKTAERAMEQFAKGDAFVAEGFTREYSYERDGHQLGGEEFIAKKIGHDSARSRYTVDRAPASHNGIQQNVPQQERAFPLPTRPATAPDATALSR